MQLDHYTEESYYEIFRSLLGPTAANKIRPAIREHGLRTVLDAMLGDDPCTVQDSPIPAAVTPLTRHKIRAALDLSRLHLRTNLARGNALTSPDATRRYLQAELRHRPHEVFCALMLDTRHRVIAFDELFTGTIDSAHVHPRVVVEKALTRRAAAVIVAHNHPSGIAEPSQADLAITRRLRDALGLIDIRLLDHFIVGDAEVVSLAERGLC